jgi:hypothetical protein
MDVAIASLHDSLEWTQTGRDELGGNPTPERTAGVEV